MISCFCSLAEHVCSNGKDPVWKSWRRLVVRTRNARTEASTLPFLRLLGDKMTLRSRGFTGIHIGIKTLLSNCENVWNGSRETLRPRLVYYRHMTSRPLGVQQRMAVFSVGRRESGKKRVWPLETSTHLMSLSSGTPRLHLGIVVCLPFKESQSKIPKRGTDACDSSPTTVTPFALLWQIIKFVLTTLLWFLNNLMRTHCGDHYC